MRKPRKYPLADGSHAWRVRYRTSSGTEKSETFYDEESAVEFSGMLKALGYARALAYLDERAKQQGDRRTKAYTLNDLFEIWMTAKRKRRDKVRSERTFDDYEKMWCRHVSKKLGTMPANLISGRDVQDWVDSLGLAPKTVRDYHALLHAVYRWAIHPNRAYVINDPCTETDLPVRRKKPPKGLRPAEWQLLHRAALEVDQDVADLLLFMVSTGWRFSECAAVQAMSVDHWMEGGTSHTYVTMGRVLRREGGSFEFVDDAKSEAGMRRVRVVGPGEEMVLRRVQGKRPNDLLLTNRQGSRWLYTTFYERYWTRRENDDRAPNRKRVLEVARELGLERPDLTPHWLRHTHVGMLILAGEPLTAIQRRLGHSSIEVTNDTYGRMVEDASEAGLDRVAAMLGGESPLLEGRHRELEGGL